jgi:Ice-binding-like/WxL domain surface cell wall-binding
METSPPPRPRTRRRGLSAMCVRHVLSAILVGGLVALGSHTGDAQAALGPAPVSLGAAGSFGVLAGSTVTSAGFSTVGGDIGVSPGTAVTGFPPGTLTGMQHDGDATGAAAHADLASAYGDAVGRSPAAPITGDLGGVTLTPGVYAAGAALTLAGNLTLDARGNPAAVFILQAGSTLGTAAGSHVNLAGGAQACNVFWQVGSSATLGASSLLNGTIIASTSITMGDGVTIDGRALARDGAVTMINDTVNAAPCTPVTSGTAPSIAPFTTQLTGRNQTITTSLGAWSVTDARDSNAGYSVTVAASRPTVGGSAAAAGTGASLTLTPGSAAADNYNPPSTAPVAALPQLLSPTPATIEAAPAGTGQGQWEFPADSGAAASLAILIPGDSAKGAYSSTLTFTTAPPVA